MLLKAGPDIGEGELGHEVLFGGCQIIKLQCYSKRGLSYERALILYLGRVKNILDSALVKSNHNLRI